MSDDYQSIGRIVRLQVQTDHLKRGEQPRRWYDPAPVTPVAALRLDDGGVVGIGDDGTIHHDVHHRDHPISRYRGDNGVSIGFTGHYTRMRDHFGSHLADGIAGENILIASDDHHTVDSLGDELLVESASGDIRIARVIVAAPCAEFTKFCLRWPHDARPDRTVTEALRFLDDGTRGFYAAYGANDSAARELRVGDRFYRAR